MGFLTDIFETIQSLILTIPLDNAFGIAYVILNTLISIYALLTYGGADGGGGLGGGGLGGGGGGL